MKKVWHKSRQLGMTSQIEERFNQEFPADITVTFLTSSPNAEKILGEILAAHPKRHPSFNQKQEMLWAIRQGDYGKALDILYRVRKP